MREPQCGRKPGGGRPRLAAGHPAPLADPWTSMPWKIKGPTGQWAHTLWKIEATQMFTPREESRLETPGAFQTEGLPSLLSVAVIKALGFNNLWKDRFVLLTQVVRDHYQRR